MKVSKNSKYQTHKKIIKLTKNPIDRTGFRKKSHSAKKTEREDPLGFSTSSLSQNIKKLKGEHFGEVFSKKVSQCQKKLMGDPLVSSGMVCYVEKEEKLFWFSSLGQMIKFGTIKFRGTFKNYFGQFVWNEKKRVPKESRFTS